MYSTWMNHLMPLDHVSHAPSPNPLPQAMELSGGEGFQAH